MDKNKLVVLKEIGYEVQPACVLCVFSEFPNDDWGTCERNTYEHNKHQEERRLSIYKSGKCPDFMLDHVKKHQLGGFAELLKETP